MKILLVDDDEILLDFERACLEEAIPGVSVTEWATLRRSKPGEDFDWASYDLLLLDYFLGNNQTGLDWLREFGNKPGFPKTILVTAVEDPYVVAKVIHSGAHGYLSKSELTPERLVSTVRDILADTPIDDTVRQSSAEEDFAKTVDLRKALQKQKRAKQGQGTEGYRFASVIARGSMSTVYLAERLEDGMTVVIKILDVEQDRDPEAVKRFELEGQLLARLDSPYVVKVYDQGFTNRYAYIVMEFFGRGDLKQRIENGVSPEGAVVYLYHIARGLEAIHRLGIVHRDLKPANIMFRTDGSMAIADFGISKHLGSDLELTSSGTILGTLHYTSPEQASGKPVDPRSDLYSAGILFYEMLTGEKPYVGRSLSSVIFQHLYAPLPVLEGNLARHQPLLERLLAKDPQERIGSATELCNLLSRLEATGTASP